ncbi:mucin-5AC-like isoform X2 [Daphnia pulicaria]|uniref:mucin-5AC-like isoform X2 n=1 Tax=Daphnia pulicaria TaxID=35523 RepID=UPI001EEA78F1|nr:mucin-5AC-like isoform X2 [Daphnia pulicaria]
MSQLSILLGLIGLMSPALASLSLHGQPLLSGVTSYALAIEQLTKIKPTTCYITEGEVTQCRRKRGMVERPIQYNGKGKIVPSAVVGIETTTIPRDLTQKEILAAHNLFSSMDDSYFQSQNIFKQLANRRRSNVITVGNCGMSTVNLVDFLSCLGMTVQETTTLTATFTETHYSSSGYTVMTVMGCTPAGFPYLYCPANLNEEQPSKPSIVLEEETLTHTTTYITTFPDGTSSSYIVTDQTVIITDIQEPSQVVTETEILPSGTEEETIQTSILPSGTEEETIQTSILPSGTEEETVQTSILPSGTEEETIQTSILPSGTEEETIQTSILPSGTEEETVQTSILPSGTEEETIQTSILPSGTEEETIQTSILPSGTEEETVQTSILPSGTEEETIQTSILPSGTEEETVQTSILPSGTEEETVQTSILPSVVIEQSTITNTVLTIVQTTVMTVAPTSTVLESPTTVTVDTEELAPEIPEIESSTDEIVAP